MTEKFLLYGGALHLAGAVHDRKNQRATASDWMELEKQRGISVSSTVLQFEYKDYVVNLLDTPGHKDFSEDTYRVLMAVDAAVMVLDAAKGIETQTLKLFEVCRMRGIPIFTFINKCDRPGKPPLGLLDEIEQSLGLVPLPMVWPIGEGLDFKGLYDRTGQQIHWFEKVPGGRFRAPVAVGGPDDPEITGKVPAEYLEKAQEELELIEAAVPELNDELIFKGEQTPVFFGSAMHNFGVQLFLDCFLQHAPSPLPRRAGEMDIHPGQEGFSGFIFKIQANMDPKHRDRLAFLRVCSGKFTRDMQVSHVQSGKKVRLAFSHQLFGQDRETMDEAWPGDILGITGYPDFGIGDTLAEKSEICYDAIPPFAPECFAFLHNTDTTNFKRFRSGIEQLLQEKVIQRFSPVDAASNIPLLGAVGPLQFDVVKYRMEAEYRAPSRLEQAPWTVCRWLDPEITLTSLEGQYLGGAQLVEDGFGRLALLFGSEWNCQYFERENPKIRLFATPPARRG